MCGALNVVDYVTGLVVTYLFDVFMANYCLWSPYACKSTDHHIMIRLTIAKHVLQQVKVLIWITL